MARYKLIDLFIYLFIVAVADPRSASYAVSKHRPPSRAAHQAVYTVGSRAFPVTAAQVHGTVCQTPSSHRHHLRLSAVN